MSRNRDLVLENLDLSYRTSVAYQFARYALGLNYESLPQDVVHVSKRCLLDALGCAVGAFDAPGRPICEAFVKEVGGLEEATVFGSGLRTNVLNATLVNSFLVRYLDYNDIGGGCHNSDAISGILAVSEKQKTNGRNLLTSIIISYELGARVGEARPASTHELPIWSHDARGGLNMPPALGKIMGLNEEQIANAIGICSSHSLPLAILDPDKEENSMAKNIRFGWVAYDAIFSCILAKNGFTGPIRVVILRGNMDLERLTDFTGWRILKTRHKYLCANATTHGHIYATLAIVKEHDLKPEDIAHVRIRAGRREVIHTTSLTRKYPRNAETADHSAFYATAMAIKERDFGPKSFEPNKFEDPVILDLIEKISVEFDPSIPEWSRQGISEITTKDGRFFQKHIKTPHGFDDDPLTDEELENKFSEMAIKFMSKDQIARLIDIIWNIEKIDDVGELTKLMVIP
jgi:2-methylcitrate dehydratase